MKIGLKDETTKPVVK